MAEYQVVTVTVAPGRGRPAHAAAFVVRTRHDGSPVLIERLPSAAGPASTPAAGTTVVPGQQIVVPATAVEGPLQAWFGDEDAGLESIGAGERQAVRTRVPLGATDETVLTVAVGTPEVPAAYAFWFPVDDGEGG
jgi:hypothetical protein